MHYTVRKFLKEHQSALCLEILEGDKGLKRRIAVPEAHRPGLFLAGYKKARAPKRVVILGHAEMAYLRDLDKVTRRGRLEDLLDRSCPAVVITRSARPMKELQEVCKREEIPLLRTSMATMPFFTLFSRILSEVFTPVLSCHGTLVEVFGVGLLILGDSSVGKSEAALGLVERGHRLVSDDVVKVRKREESYVEGFGAELTRHHMEIRGIGIINVANLYGAVCVRESKRIDVVVQMEEWDENHFYDRIGIDESFTTMLDVSLPFLVLPVKPGRDVVLLLETITLNHRLKGMGYHSAKEFNKKLLELTERKRPKKKKFLGTRNGGG